MRSHARLLGHPVHRMLIVLPLGLLGTAVVFDLIDLATGTGAFNVAAYWMIAAGVALGWVAAPFGFVDWMHIPAGTRARRIGAVHGLGNVVVTALFAASWVLRTPEAQVPVVALALSLGGAALALVTAWLGGELVTRLGVGVDENAGVDAPSSLQAGHESAPAPRERPVRAH